VSKSRSFTTSGIVIKRSNVNEADRIVHLITQEFGKLTVVAKGVRKLNSVSRSALEIGNHVHIFCVITKSLPLLTQARIIDDCRSLPNTLAKHKQLAQLLELFDRLLVETELETDLFSSILHLRNAVVYETANSQEIIVMLRELIVTLGFQDPADSKYETISEYVSALSDRPLKSFAYLSVS
jgi:DNA repair protein RecO (recombination protein O)